MILLFMISYILVLVIIRAGIKIFNNWMEKFF